MAKTIETSSPPDSIARLIALGLTRSEARVFHALFEGARLNGYQPSMRALGAELGSVSPNAIFEVFVRLEKKGWIRRGATDKRAAKFLLTTAGKPFIGFTLPEDLP
jgi:SOS-response transcriptional repressor LexA